MQLYLLGMISMASLVAALFFLRFWRTTGDRLFMMFALAFALEAVNRALFAYAGAPPREEATLYFVMRLAAYMLILLAVIDKNLRRR